MSKKILPVVNDPAWAQWLEQEFDEYMAQCEEQVDWVEGEPEIEDTLSGEAFCGCSTCYTREQLFFLIPHIIKGYLDGKVGIKVEE